MPEKELGGKIRIQKGKRKKLGGGTGRVKVIPKPNVKGGKWGLRFIKRRKAPTRRAKVIQGERNKFQGKDLQGKKLRLKGGKRVGKGGEGFTEGHYEKKQCGESSSKYKRVRVGYREYLRIFRGIHNLKTTAAYGKRPEL